MSMGNVYNQLKRCLPRRGLAREKEEEAAATGAPEQTTVRKRRGARDNSLL